ncbi:MAG: ECF transporter S component [Lachnospiraceae bacterium]
MNGLMESVTENLMFVLEFLGVIALMFVLAVIIEKAADKRRGVKRKMFTTRMMAMVGMFSAIAVILHMFDFPLPFLAPGFYKVDFSELPVMIGTFAFGPVAGVMIEFCKILLKLVFKGTSTAFVGDLANFAVGCSLLLPASAVYEFTKSKKGAIAGCITGTLCMTVFGSLFNAVYLIPKFVVLYGLPSVDTIIEMGQAVNPAITNLTTFVCLAVAPLNLLKAGVISLITMVIYKPLSPIIKEGHAAVQKKAVSH